MPPLWEKSSADRWRTGVESRKEKLIQALASEIQIVDTVLFGTDCTYARMEELAEHAKKCGADMIFGMGSGKALDTAKGTAEKAGLPVFTFPDYRGHLRGNYRAFRCV